MERTASMKTPSDMERSCGPQPQLNSRADSRVMSGQLKRSFEPVRIIFLDIDGVLAPRRNNGQIVYQCVEGVVALCRLARARIVLTSAWRLYKGQTEVFNKLLKRHHNAEAIYDVVPDLKG